MCAVRQVCGINFFEKINIFPSKIIAIPLFKRMRALKKSKHKKSKNQNKKTMNTIKFYKFAVVVLCTLFAVAITSCSDDDDDNSKLKFNPSSVTVAVGSSQTVAVAGGTEAYTIKSSDEKIAKASVNKSTITVSGVKEGKATMIVTDSKKITGSFNVTVKK